MSVTKVPMRGVNTAVDTAAGDDANIGYTSAEGLILTGQGSTNDVTIKNDADADVIKIATGGTTTTFAGDVTIAGYIAQSDSLVVPFITVLPRCASTPISMYWTPSNISMMPPSMLWHSLWLSCLNCRHWIRSTSGT